MVSIHWIYSSNFVYSILVLVFSFWIANQFKIRIESSRDGQSVTWGKMDIQLINANGLNETFVLTQESDELKEGEKIQVKSFVHICDS